MPSLNAMAKEAKTKKSTMPKKATKKAPPPAVNLSSEFVQDSDIDQDEKSDAASSSDDEGLPPEKLAATAPKTNDKAPAPAVNGTSSSGSESDSSEASSSEDEDEDGEEPSKVIKKVSISSAKLQFKASATKVVSFKETSPYKPPSGFELASLEGETPEASQLFKNSRLEGKQIWYITAPATVPISSIQETTLGNINKGNAILSHNGNDYGFTEDSSENVTSMKIMVPKVSDESYHAGAKPIHKILHLQQIVKLPSVYDANTKQASDNAARPTIPAKKLVRQQPPGLKMRFRPIGFGSGSTGIIGSSSSSIDGSGAESASDQEMEDAPPPFHRPASLDAEESATSSDGSSEDSSSSSDAQMTEAPPLPSKPAGKTHSEKAVAKKPSKVADHPLKRKHSEAGDIKAKNSSSSSEAYTSNRELKRLKKKQTNSLAGSQSVSTETHKTSSSKLPHVATTSTTPIPLPKANRNHIPNSSSQILPSPAKSAPILPPKSSRVSPPRTSQNSNAPPPSQKMSETPSRDKDKTHDAGARVGEKERKKEAKRLKMEKSTLQSKADVKESVTGP